MYHSVNLRNAGISCATSEGRHDINSVLEEYSTGKILACVICLIFCLLKRAKLLVIHGSGLFKRRLKKMLLPKSSNVTLRKKGQDLAAEEEPSMEQLLRSTVS